MPSRDWPVLVNLWLINQCPSPDWPLFNEQVALTWLAHSCKFLVNEQVALTWLAHSCKSLFNEQVALTWLAHSCKSLVNQQMPSPDWPILVNLWLINQRPHLIGPFLLINKCPSPDWPVLVKQQVPSPDWPILVNLGHHFIPAFDCSIVWYFPQRVVAQLETFTKGDTRPALVEGITICNVQKLCWQIGRALSS